MFQDPGTTPSLELAQYKPGIGPWLDHIPWCVPDVAETDMVSKGFWERCVPACRPAWAGDHGGPATQYGTCLHGHDARRLPARARHVRGRMHAFPGRM